MTEPIQKLGTFGYVGICVNCKGYADDDPMKPKFIDYTDIFVHT